MLKDLTNKAKNYFFEKERLGPWLGILRMSFLNFNEIVDLLREKRILNVSQDISCHSDTQFGTSVELEMRWLLKKLRTARYLKYQNFRTTLKL